jgi:hypothetical protein
MHLLFPFLRKRLASDWTLGPEIQADPYHIPIVRSQLTRNLGNFFSDLQEEIVLAFDEIIKPTEGSCWYPPYAFSMLPNAIPWH